MSLQFNKFSIALVAIALSSSITSVYATSDTDNSWAQHSLQNQAPTSNQQLALTPVTDNTGALDQVYSEKDLFPPASPTQQQAFQTTAKAALPMTPEEIRKLKAMMYYSKEAAAAPVGIPPKPVLSTQLVTLSPGSTPPVVRLQEGFVTTILFVDDSGSSWAISSYDLGDPKSFDIQFKEKTNKLMIQPLNIYRFGNLVVNLRGLDTPIIITLVPAKKVVDYRVDFQIPEAQPGGSQPTESSTIGPSDPMLLDILNGIPPVDAEVVKIDGGECEGWMINDKLYIRTKLIILSPGWIAMMKNSDGTRAYELGKTSTILVSKYGKPVELQLEGTL